MVPPKSHPRYRELVTGSFSHSFRLMPAGMCVTRNLRAIRIEGGQPEVVQQAIEDVHEFFAKYEPIMADDLKDIFG
ncbi:MAG TPA: hypothetical protein PKO15_01250 [Fibrobacteria bacterium]|nr:hypothetical protein [Fibrobacteria bacterium]HOX51255.1 hypothetical protein [Fibrobacteria bacterium]